VKKLSTTRDLKKAKQDLTRRDYILKHEYVQGILGVESPLASPEEPEST